MEITQVETGRTWKGWLWQKGTDFWNWMRHGIDWAFVGAALVEIPRYTAAFLAIHEPWYIGVPLAALLAWSTKSAWEYVFERGWRKSWIVTILDIVALAVAVCIITPVIYLMMSAPIDQIDMTTFDLWTADPVQLFWSFCMSLCTFLPLMLVAAVKAGKAREAADTGTDKTDTKTDTGTDTEAAVVTKEAVRQPKKLVAQAAELTFNGTVIDMHAGETISAVTMDQHRNGVTEPLSQEKLDAWQRSKNGWTQGDIAAHFGKSDRTIRNWIKEVEEFKGGEGK
jgi:DNA-binding transcriptional regulator YiaG